MADPAATSAALLPPTSPSTPRITITYCTQCKWLLRAAYYAQELLSTFGTALGEVVLRPATGGLFMVDVAVAGTVAGTSSSGGGMADGDAEITTLKIWDRKVDGGFPETKILKRKVRDIIDPERGLGHVDRDHAPPSATTGTDASASAGTEGGAGSLGKPSIRHGVDVVEQEGSTADGSISGSTVQGSEIEGKVEETAKGKCEDCA